MRVYEFNYKGFLEACNYEKKDLVIQETWPKTKGLYVLEGENNTVFRTGHLYVMSGLPIRQLSKPTCAADGKKTWTVAL